MTVYVPRPVEVEDVAGAVLPGLEPEVPPGFVRTASGAVVEAETARWLHEVVPANTRRARESRTEHFVRWCTENGRLTRDPGAVLDYLRSLGELGYAADTLAAYLTPLVHQLALSGTPLSAGELAECRALINRRSQLQAADTDSQTDALQAPGLSEDDVRAMLGTLDRSTVRGRRDALALLLAWHLGARSCEPGSVQARDVREARAHLTDGAGRRVPWPVLVVRLRLSKTNPYGRSLDVVRVMAQTDPAVCLVRAWRAWRADLAAIGEESRGLLLRGVTGERIATAERPGRGRPPKNSADRQRRAGVGERFVRELIRSTATAAGVSRTPTADEREVLSVRAENEAAAAAPTPGEAARVRAEWRRRRRAVRRALARPSGHSMRRGQARHLQGRGVPLDVLARQLRYAPGSSALYRYLAPNVPDRDNPTRPDL